MWVGTISFNFSRNFDLVNKKANSDSGGPHTEHWDIMLWGGVKKPNKHIIGCTWKKLEEYKFPDPHANDGSSIVFILLNKTIKLKRSNFPGDFEPWCSLKITILYNVLRL